MLLRFYSGALEMGMIQEVIERSRTIGVKRKGKKEIEITLCDLTRIILPMSLKAWEEYQTKAFIYDACNIPMNPVPIDKYVED